MKRFSYILLTVLLTMIQVAVVRGQSLYDAADQAAAYFAESGEFKASQEVIIGVKNYHSQKKDQTAR